MQIELPDHNPFYWLSEDRRGMRAVYNAGFSAIHSLVDTFNPSGDKEFPISLEKTLENLTMLDRAGWVFRFLVRGGSPIRDICYVAGRRDRDPENHWRQYSTREWTIEVWTALNVREKARNITRKRLNAVIADLVQKADARSPVLQQLV